MKEQTTYTLSLNEANLEMAEHVDALARYVGRAPKLQPSAPNQKIIAATHGLLESTKVLTRGDAISTILRLPIVWQQPILEYIQGSGSYFNTPNIKSILKNIGSSTIRVFVAEHRVQKIVYATGQPQDDYDVVKVHDNLEPGEEIELDSKFAVHALWNHGRFAASVPFWAKMGANAFNERNLVEVAFTAQWYSVNDSAAIGGIIPVQAQQQLVPTVLDSRRWQRERVAAAIDELKGAKSELEAKAILSGIAPWWPLDDEARKVIAKRAA